MAYFLVFISIIIILFYFLLKPAKTSAGNFEKFQGRNFAHRGLHTKDKSTPENSLVAFDAAATNGYGMELDVQLSKDGHVVVFHDDDLTRVCNIEGRVDEYTLEELQKMKLCETEQTIPLFTEVLDLVNGRTPLIVELKTGKNNVELCTKTLEILKNYKGDFCIESFDPRIVAWFKKNAPEIIRGQLSTVPKDFDTLPKVQKIALGLLLTNIISRPHFIAYGTSKKPFLVNMVLGMGAFSVRWTVRDTDDFKAEEELNDSVIFEYYLPKTKYE